MASIVAIVAAGCPSPENGSTGEAPGSPASPGRGRSKTPPTDTPPVIFKERARETGLDFVHERGSFGRFHVAEITCGGGGFLDFDGDGDLDVYLSQGSELGPAARRATSGSSSRSDRLYRNDLASGGSLRFTDVTDASGLAGARGYGCGAATGDFDNDGRTDLLVLNLGANQLWHNQGGGADGRATFRDVTAEVAPALLAERSSTAAAFFDYDRDGWLDIFVGNYVRFYFEDPPRCYDQTGAPDYCGPTAFPNEANQLLHNRGPSADGRVTFEDVSAAVGVDRPPDPTLGVVTADFDGDGRLDVYVANDGEPNRLWMNRSGTFTDEAVLAGCGVNSSGASEASMGVAAGDVDGDGDLDLFMTHLVRETNTLYLNDGRGFFEDRTLVSGLGAASLSFTSFGTAFADYDNDGRLDLLVVSGAVTKLPSLWSSAAPGTPTAGTQPAARREKATSADDAFSLDLPSQLFRNMGSQGGSVKFSDVTAEAGPALALAEVSRGALLGDVDNDGDTDVVIVNNGGPVHLLVNEVGQESHWLGLRLVAGAPPRDELGARAAVLRDGQPQLWRRVQVDGGYNAAHDPRVLFGLGDDPRVDGVRVVWPGGAAEEWADGAVDGYTTLVKGSGRDVADQR